MSWNYSCAELLGLPGLWGSLLADLRELQLRGTAWPSWVMGLLTSRSPGTTAAWSCLDFRGYGAPWLWGSLLADLLELQLLGAAWPSWNTSLSVNALIVSFSSLCPNLVSADPEGLGLRAVDDPTSALIPELWLYLETIQRSAPLENNLDLDKDGAATDI
ncbi:hypothetical protein NDU88_000145 [Pleurodeles waltl]|uniref:Uncharacterized protein n=1 Tax=Pleurodeles waltl TaxID=8319 RepID=A0AAV7V6R1_PLEWA|nr:hypothetical protein NDU88_000145 [Pleurodeles waltl]